MHCQKNKFFTKLANSLDNEKNASETVKNVKILFSKILLNFDSHFNIFFSHNC